VKQTYIGVKKIEAEPMRFGEFAASHGEGFETDRENDPGYQVTYPDGYVSWSPKDTFEAAYFPLENPNVIGPNDVERFAANIVNSKIGEKTTVVMLQCLTGFEITETSSCVDPEMYDHNKGIDIALGRIQSAVWGHLGFVLQWALNGIAAEDDSGFGPIVTPERPSSRSRKERQRMTSTVQDLVLCWRKMPTDPVFGWGLRCDQEWLEHGVGPAGYEIRKEIYGSGYHVTWWHGNRGYPIGSNVDTVDEAKTVASRHIARILKGIYAQNVAPHGRRDSDVPCRRLVGLIDDMLDNAQSIRIIQQQSHIAKRHKEKADAAWQHLNAAHRKATELLQPNRILTNSAANNGIGGKTEDR
jgi:hypothetical protein